MLTKDASRTITGARGVLVSDGCQEVVAGAGPVAMPAAYMIVLIIGRIS